MSVTATSTVKKKMGASRSSFALVVRVQRSVSLGTVKLGLINWPTSWLLSQCVIMTEKEEYKFTMNYMLILYDFFYWIVDLVTQYSAYFKKNPVMCQALYYPRK